MSQIQPDLRGRTAILGGTFNPVHTGHLRMALETGEALGLAHVELTPCAVPPHKSGKGLLPFELRETFLRAALSEAQNEDRDDAPATNTVQLSVSSLEAELPPPSYTANLLRAWADRHKTPPLFILGDEDFACIDTWREGLQLPSVTDFVVVARSGSGSLRFEETVQRLWPDKGPRLCTMPASVPDMLHVSLSPGRTCVFMPLPRLDISASRVRELWLSGRNTRYLVPDAVRRLMRAHATALHNAWDN